MPAQAKTGRKSIYFPTFRDLELDSFRSSDPLQHFQPVFWRWAELDPSFQYPSCFIASNHVPATVSSHVGWKSGSPDILPPALTSPSGTQCTWSAKKPFEFCYLVRKQLICVSFCCRAECRCFLIANYPSALLRGHACPLSSLGAVNPQMLPAV